MPAEDPLVSAAPPSVRVTTPRQLLSLVSVLLGFYPRASVVILGVGSPRGTLKVIQRCPGYGPGDPDGAARTVRDVVALLASQQCPRAAAVGYGPDEHVAPFIGLLREQAARHGIELIELLRAEGSRYWSYACADPACCPPEGSPYDDTLDPALAALLPEGVPAVLPSREAPMTSMSSQAGTAPHGARQPATPGTLPLRVPGAQEPPFPVPRWKPGAPGRAEPDPELMRRVSAALKRL